MPAAKKAKKKSAGKDLTTPEVAAWQDHWGPYARIEALGTIKVDYLRAQILKGVPLASIARRIHHDWKAFGDVTEASTIELLKKWRDSHIVPSMNGALWESSKGDLVEALEKIDVVQEMVDLCVKQKKRVDRALTLESTAPTLLSATTKEIETMGKLLKDLASVEIETGLLKRKPKSGVGTISQDPSNPGLLQFEWTEKDDEEYEALLAEFEVLKAAGGDEDGEDELEEGS